MMPTANSNLLAAGLAPFHAKRLALVLWVQSRQCVFRGIGRFEVDPSLGAILRILPTALDSSEREPEFILCEESWRGEFVLDQLYGCEYAVNIGAATV